MSTCDNDGRPYAKLSLTKPGDMLIADAGFECILAWKSLEVKADLQGLYVDCAEGKHYLDGQADDGEHLIGLYFLGALLPLGAAPR